MKESEKYWSQSLSVHGWAIAHTQGTSAEYSRRQNIIERSRPWESWLFQKEPRFPDMRLWFVHQLNSVSKVPLRFRVWSCFSVAPQAKNLFICGPQHLFGGSTSVCVCIWMWKGLWSFKEVWTQFTLSSLENRGVSHASVLVSNKNSNKLWPFRAYCCIAWWKTCNPSSLSHENSHKPRVF